MTNRAKNPHSCFCFDTQWRELRYIKRWNWNMYVQFTYKTQKKRGFKGTVSRDFLIRFMTLKTKSVLFVQALIV